MFNTITLAAVSANDNARPFVSIRTLLCDACGERASVANGFCKVCDDEMRAHYFVGDDEGELLTRGVPTDDKPRC